MDPDRGCANAAGGAAPLVPSDAVSLVPVPKLIATGGFCIFIVSPESDLKGIVTAIAAVAPSAVEDTPPTICAAVDLERCEGEFRIADDPGTGREGGIVREGG